MRSLIVVAVCTAFLMGCETTPMKTPLIESNRSNTPIKVFSVVSQKEMEAVVPFSDGSVPVQGGLLGMVILGAIAANDNQNNAEIAELSLAPIRDSLIEFRFTDLFASEITTAFGDSQSVSVESVERMNDESEVKAKVGRGDIYLVINSEYKMTVEFNSSFITSTVKMYRATLYPNEPEMLYYNEFVTFGEFLPFPVKTQQQIDSEIALIKANYHSLTEKEKSSKENRARYFKGIKNAKRKYSREQAMQYKANQWANEYNDSLKQSLRTGIAEILNLIKQDIDDPLDSKQYEVSAKNTPDYFVGHKSTILKLSDERIVLRSANMRYSGAICSAPRKAVNGNKIALC